jgi:hypothetical protein
MHAMICAVQTTSVSTNDIRCQTDKASKDRQFWTIFWTSIPYASPALQHPDPPSSMRTTVMCMQYAMQAASSILQQNRRTRAVFAGVEGLRPLTYAYALPLHIFRDLHCIARAYVQHGGKKHVSSLPRWCETTQRTWKKSGHGNGMRTPLRTFVRI